MNHEQWIIDIIDTYVIYKRDIYKISCKLL